MNWDEYAEWSARIAAWGAEYRKTLRERPVRAQTKPGEIAARLPPVPPETPEDMEAIFADWEIVHMQEADYVSQIVAVKPEKADE